MAPVGGHEDAWSRPSRAPPRVFPLNSKRLTSQYVISIARAMGLTTKGSVEATKLIIEGKLTEMSREPRNVQVEVDEGDDGRVCVRLCDSHGAFVEAECSGTGIDDETVREPEASETGSEHRGDRERADSDSSSHESVAAGLEDVQTQNRELMARNDELTAEVGALKEEISALADKLKGESERVNEVWRMSCEQLSSFDEMVISKDAEVGRLKARIAEMEGSREGTPATTRPEPRPHHPSTTFPLVPHSSSGAIAPATVARGSLTTPRRGKAPPVSEFTGEDPNCTLEDWLPSLERAILWNAWTEEEQVIQLAGHLKSRALQEWNLLGTEEKSSFSRAVEALRLRLDCGDKTLAAQDFRHSAQREGESVGDFVRRLERTFRIAYGRDHMSPETKDLLLYGQLQEGLHLQLMRAPAVSGSKNYQELVIAAKNEERRLADFKRRQEYVRSSTSQTPSKQKSSTDQQRPVKNKYPQSGNDQQRSFQATDSNPDSRKCFYCKKPGHLIQDCLQRKKKEGESRGPSRPPSAKQVVAEAANDGVSAGDASSTNVSDGGAQQPTGDGSGVTSPQEDVNPLSLLFSESDEDGDVKQVMVTDSGSHPQLARVNVMGVPADGVVDTAADITIMGGKLFAMVASSARLRKKDFKPPDKVPRTYDRKVFQLNGRMEMEIAFAGKAMRTMVYIKMDAHDQLLLSEGVCRQLGIVTYHPSLLSQDRPDDTVEEPTLVPSVRVRLLQSPPNQSAAVLVEVEDQQLQGCAMLVEGHKTLEMDAGVIVEEAVIPPSRDGLTCLMVTNLSGFTSTLPPGLPLGTVQPVDLLVAGSESAVANGDLVSVQKLSSSQQEWRIEKLLQELQLDKVPTEEAPQLREFLAQYHMVFSLQDGERGETGLVTMSIDTGDASPCRQPPRRMPFVVRQEVTKQLRDMQKNGVIQPSASPWSSPVVMVKKKDGSHRFCVDYRGLNARTKPDAFPLPRIDDLLDQLGGAKYFSTLDLASGFWKIQMEPQSRVKTAFTTPHGLYEFLVMPFGLTNAPAVFQRLIQKVISGLNPADGGDFVAAYLDDILVFSHTLSDHLDHLRKVLDRLLSVNLKLKPSKCKFVRKEVEYLGHVVTSSGLRPNARLTEAIQGFSRPEDVGAVRRFLGLASYYRRFIPRFAKIAHPLHGLTTKNAPFDWTSACETAFTTLKSKLVSPPVLAYRSFDKDFTLETDASILGLGAVLSQKQDDSRSHPIAYASRALNRAEKNYSITELETLAVVWGISHFHFYLYGKAVRVLTDHSAVKAVLETSNPTGKHARWWTKVYGSGVRDVTIIYRAGRDNASADALSRSPYGSPPAEGIAEGEVQVASIATEDIATLLQAAPLASTQVDYYSEQAKDPDLRMLIEFLREGKLPENPTHARKVAAQESQYSIVDGILYYVDHRHDNCRRVAVPQHLRERLLQETHGGRHGGHFSNHKIYNTLLKHWWWPGMHADVVTFCKRCPDCAIVTGGSRQHRPPLRPIPVERPFQKIGVDIMDLPCTLRGNRHVVVFQDMLTKWPMVFPVPDQKAERLARLLCEEIVPMFGVPEALLSDRGANLLSHLMLDVCAILGIEKLNTTSYHPQCDGMIERFNRTLKTMLRKRAAQYGVQWDNHLPALLWAYRNTQHDSTGEKPSFLLFGWDCRSPLEASLLPVSDNTQYTTVADYREELVHTLSSARRVALEHIRSAQGRYKAQYDRRTDSYQYRVGDWVLIRFPSDESGKLRKLSRPWHGPYRITSCNDTNVTAVKVYFPRENPIQVHQMRVKPCPDGFPSGYYWYEGKRQGPGRPPRWVQTILSGDTTQPDDDSRIEDDAIVEPSIDDDPATSLDVREKPQDLNTDSDSLADAVQCAGTDTEMDQVTDDECNAAGADEAVADMNTPGDVGQSMHTNLTSTLPKTSRYALRTTRRPPERLV